MLFRLIDSTCSDISNSNIEENSQEMPGSNNFKNQSDLPTCNYPDVATTEDKSHDSYVMDDDQMWLDEYMDCIDPLKNVQIEPLFQYPTMENDCLYPKTSS